MAYGVSRKVSEDIKRKGFPGYQVDGMVNPKKLKEDARRISVWALIETIILGIFTIMFASLPLLMNRLPAPESVIRVKELVADWCTPSICFVVLIVGIMAATSGVLRGSQENRMQERHILTESYLIQRPVSATQLDPLRMPEIFFSVDAARANAMSAAATIPVRVGQPISIPVPVYFPSFVSPRTLPLPYEPAEDDRFKSDDEELGPEVHSVPVARPLPLSGPSSYAQMVMEATPEVAQSSPSLRFTGSRHNSSSPSAVQEPEAPPIAMVGYVARKPPTVLPTSIPTREVPQSDPAPTEAMDKIPVPLVETPALVNEVYEPKLAGHVECNDIPEREVAEPDVLVYEEDVEHEVPGENKYVEFTAPVERESVEQIPPAENNVIENKLSEEMEAIEDGELPESNQQVVELEIEEQEFIEDEKSAETIPVEHEEQEEMRFVEQKEPTESKIVEHAEPAKEKPVEHMESFTGIPVESATPVAATISLPKEPATPKARKREAVALRDIRNAATEKVHSTPGSQVATPVLGRQLSIPTRTRPREVRVADIDIADDDDQKQSDDDVDQRVEAFLRKFREQMRLQRQESLQRHRRGEEEP